jgi:hypothetical protein
MYCCAQRSHGVSCFSKWDANRSLARGCFGNRTNTVFYDSYLIFSLLADGLCRRLPSEPGHDLSQTVESRLADIGGGASGRFVLGVLIRAHFLALSYTVSTHCFRKMRTLSSRKKPVAQIL